MVIVYWLLRFQKVIGVMFSNMHFLIIYNKNLKNPSSNVFALRASVLMSRLCACEHAPAQALTLPHVASQHKTSTEEKQKKTLPL